VDAACTRAIIIDRGKIVANGTPAELRQKSEWAGAVTLRVKGVAKEAVTTKLYQVPLVNKVTVVDERDGLVTVHVFPKPSAANGGLAGAIGEAAHGWQIELLQREEGRLDEVFRAITMPDTAKEAAK
jgi:ABC-2 type transport system ATP-binding protein